MNKIMPAIFFLTIMLSGCSNVSSEEKILNEAYPRSETINTEDYSLMGDYKDFIRYPEENKFKPVTVFLGEVIQTMEDRTENYNFYLLDLSIGIQGEIPNRLVALGIHKDYMHERILEGDYIQIYGKTMGTWVYETVEGLENEVPLVFVEYYQ